MKRTTKKILTTFFHNDVPLFPGTVEEQLNKIALFYELLFFEDMTFKNNSIVGDVFAESEQHIFRKKKDYYNVEGIGFNLSIAQCPFRLKKMKGIEGRFNCWNKNKLSIDIHPERNIQCTVLHEMIHFYDWQIDRCFPYPLRDILIIRLYDKLKTQIEKLDLLLMTYAHYDNQHEIIIGKEGDHSVLFYMKSLDLEIRTNVEFGTISGFFSEKPIKRIA